MTSDGGFSPKLRDSSSAVSGDEEEQHSFTFMKLKTINKSSEVGNESSFEHLSLPLGVKCVYLQYIICILQL